MKTVHMSKNLTDTLDKWQKEHINILLVIQTWCTNTSCVPSSGVMKPQPFITLNHLHFPRRNSEPVFDSLSASIHIPMKIVWTVLEKRREIEFTIQKWWLIWFFRAYIDFYKESMNFQSKIHSVPPFETLIFYNYFHI